MFALNHWFVHQLWFVCKTGCIPGFVLCLLDSYPTIKIQTTLCESSISQFRWACWAFQLKAWWPFSSDLWHQEGLFTQITGYFFPFFRTIVCKHCWLLDVSEIHGYADLDLTNSHNTFKNHLPYVSDVHLKSFKFLKNLKIKCAL